MGVEKLLIDSTKKAIDMAVQVALKSPEIIEELIALMKEDKEKVSARATRVVYFSFVKEPEVFEPYFSEFVDIIERTHHNGLRQSLLKIFNYGKYPTEERALSKLIDLCFRYLQNTESTPAVKVYSLETVYNLSQTHFPDLRNEILCTVDDRRIKESPATRCRSEQIKKKILKDMATEN